MGDGFGEGAELGLVAINFDGFAGALGQTIKAQQKLD
jgi:hypothetical protein